MPVQPHTFQVSSLLSTCQGCGPCLRAAKAPCRGSHFQQELPLAGAAAPAGKGKMLLQGALAACRQGLQRWQVSSLAGRTSCEDVRSRRLSRRHSSGRSGCWLGATGRCWDAAPCPVSACCWGRHAGRRLRRQLPCGSVRRMHAPQGGLATVTDMALAASPSAGVLQKDMDDCRQGAQGRHSPLGQLQPRLSPCQPGFITPMLRRRA